MELYERIRRAADYIHEKYDEDLRLGDIAAQVYLSPSYFSMLFRVMTGYTVREYLNRYRLYRAAMELKEKRTRMILVACGHGFSSQQAFTKRFTQIYGMPPGRFRRQNPPIAPFPPKSIWKESEASMELKDCFKKVEFLHKDAFYVVGEECDIHYQSPEGTDPIRGVWKTIRDRQIASAIADQVSDGVIYGMTYGETAEDTGKYMAGVEVRSLERLPVGWMARKFDACDFAVFQTTLSILETGAFWRHVYRTWLPGSKYRLPDEANSDQRCTFAQYPAIEVYDKTFVDKESVIRIYAPVMLK